MLWNLELHSHMYTGPCCRSYHFSVMWHTHVAFVLSELGPLSTSSSSAYWTRLCPYQHKLIPSKCTHNTHTHTHTHTHTQWKIWENHQLSKIRWSSCAAIWTTNYLQYLTTTENNQYGYPSSVSWAQGLYLSSTGLHQWSTGMPLPP